MYSQTNEDAVLKDIFDQVAPQTKKCVEICAGSGRESNTANLIINKGWDGLLVDGNKKLVEVGRKFFARFPKAKAKYVHKWVTCNNVNSLLRDNGFCGKIDLLSIDLDGVDYWIWKTIWVTDPLVVVVEYNQMLGPKRLVTIPYDNKFNTRDPKWPKTGKMANYFGASLSAMVKLGSDLGYRFVGCNDKFFNAFFVQEELASYNGMPAASISDCFKHPRVKWSMKVRYPTVKHLPWIKV